LLFHDGVLCIQSSSNRENQYFELENI
jgi:hypothetical protein